MYRFQVECHTSWGETVWLVGSSPSLGSWKVEKALPLKPFQYPLWRSEPLAVAAAAAKAEVAGPQVASRLEYKYVKRREGGSVEWEQGSNRWVPLDEGGGIVVQDGAFGVARPEPFSVSEEDDRPTLHDPAPGQQRILVIGSSVAEGFNAWRKHGWAWHLGEALARRYGHELINASQCGANTAVTKERFEGLMKAWKPDIVIIALSLGNEGLAHCPPGERRAAQHRFEQGLLDLLRMAVGLSASPVLGGVYPNGDFVPETYRMLKETAQTMRGWGVPILEWLQALDDGHGRWKDGLWFDHAHPNSKGHQRMFESIDLSLFDPDATPEVTPIIRRRSSIEEFNKLDRKTSVSSLDKALQQSQEEARRREREVSIVFDDGRGFSLAALEGAVSVRNKTTDEYCLHPGWRAIAEAIAGHNLRPGTYHCSDGSAMNKAVLLIGPDGHLGNGLVVPAGADAVFTPSFPAWDDH